MRMVMLVYLNLGMGGIFDFTIDLTVVGVELKNGFESNNSGKQDMGNYTGHLHDLGRRVTNEGFGLVEFHGGPLLVVVSRVLGSPLGLISDLGPTISPKT